MTTARRSPRAGDRTADRTVVCNEELEPLRTQLPTVLSDTTAEIAKREVRTFRLLSKNFLIFTLLVVLTVALWDDLMLRERNDIMGDFNSVALVTRDDLSPKYSILPKRLYSVIGLESSGTQFVTKLIQEAIDPDSVYREGHAPCKPLCRTGLCRIMNDVAQSHPCNENNDIQAQHFSLPWGSRCEDHSEGSPVIDVVLPPQCTRDQSGKSEVEECNAMAEEIWDLQLDGRPMSYPLRYQLDLVASKRWYNKLGVDQVFVIVVRDRTISYTARSHIHCKNETLRTREEDVGTKLIIDAINAFILQDESGLNVTNYNRWVAGKFQQGNPKRRHLDSSKSAIPSAIPSNNGVVVVSYEMLIKLGETYIRMLLETLGIDQRRVNSVDIKDSNSKYVNTTLLEDNPQQSPGKTGASRK